MGHLGANVRLTLTPPDGGPVRSGPYVCYAGLDSRSELLRPVLLAHARVTRAWFLPATNNQKPITDLPLQVSGDWV